MSEKLCQVNNRAQEVLTYISPYPLPLSIGIIGLGGNSRKIFEFEGLIRKISRNKDLAC